MQRISVTTLEKFRRFIDGVSEWDTEASLIESLEGKFTGNDKTKVGSAYHLLIEGKAYSAPNLYEAEGIWFTKEQAKAGLLYRATHLSMKHEVVCHKVYDTDYWPIQVSGRVDGIDGREIHDVKLKFGRLDWTEYMKSCQWKFYLDMMDTDVFWYDVFMVHGFDALVQEPYTLPDVTIKAEEPMKCTAYPRMQADNLQLLNHFLEYIHDRNLVHLLKPAVDYD
jgi:hypothetical protein